MTVKRDDWIELAAQLHALCPFSVYADVERVLGLSEDQVNGLISQIRKLGPSKLGWMIIYARGGPADSPRFFATDQDWSDQFEYSLHRSLIFRLQSDIRFALNQKSQFDLLSVNTSFSRKLRRLYAKRSWHYEQQARNSQILLEEILDDGIVAA